jgi:hypothetical protein
VKKALRLLGTAVLVTLAIRVADWLLFPALPLMVTLLTIGLVTYVVMIGRRGL